MIELFLFLGLGVAVSNYGKPLQLAGVFVGATAVLSLIFGSSVMEILFASAILYAFSAFVYMLVERYCDSILATFGILLGAIAIMFGAAFYA